MIDHIPETVSVTLTDSQREIIAAQVASGRIASASDYLRELLAADERAKELAEIESKLLQAIGADKWTDVGPDFASELYQRAVDRVARERQ